MSLEALLKTFDAQSDEKLDDLEITSGLSHFEKTLAKAGDTPSFELEAEQLAWGLRPSRLMEESSVWGTHYRPNFVWENANGDVETEPAIALFTEDAFEYWEKRAVTARHPLLRFRYASLVWDLRGKLDRSKRGIHFAELLIDAAIAVADKQLCVHQLCGVDQLAYALQVAISTKRESELAGIRASLIAFESANSEDDKCGTWGYCFDLIVQNRKSRVTDEERDGVVGVIQDRFDRLVESPHLTSLWPTESCVNRLASYYRRQADARKLQSLLERYARRVVELSQNVNGAVGVTWLQNAHRLLVDFNATDTADELNEAFRAAGARAKEGMVPITHETRVTDDEMREFLSSIVVDSFEQSLLNLAIHYVPDKAKAASNVLQAARDFPLSNLFGVTKLDSDGRVVAQVGTAESDIDGKVVLRVSEDMGFVSVFLRKAIEHFELLHLDNGEELNRFIDGSASFSPDCRPVVQIALRHYWNQEYLEFIYLIVPQIEAAIRNTVTRFRGTTLKKGRNGALALRNLDELIREPCFLQLFDPMGESVVHYFRVLMTDQRGWNLRNCIAHGIEVVGGIGPMAADRLFHLILLLALIREPERAATQPTDGLRKQDME